ncbi:TRAP transporter small permease [Flintibacter muris]|uniref:TRAP transporter small permease n=1 Tax=Flintibacter muris TaxID=2941327 RepID=UPI00203A8EFA|nr:TRAP transporter small permease [Flintibacter muris]
MKKLYPNDRLAALIFAVMLFITFMNVVSRYVLRLGISWSEEVVAHLAVLLSGLGASQAVRNESHYDIPLLEGLVSPRVSRCFKVFSAVLNMLFCIYMTYAGITMVQQQFKLGKVTTMLRWPEWVWGLAVPIGCGFMAYYSIIVLIRTLRHRGQELSGPEGSDAKGETE